VSLDLGLSLILGLGLDLILGLILGLGLDLVLGLGLVLFLVIGLGLVLSLVLALGLSRFMKMIMKTNCYSVTSWHNSDHTSTIFSSFFGDDRSVTSIWYLDYSRHDSTSSSWCSCWSASTAWSRSW